MGYECCDRSTFMGAGVGLSFVCMGTISINYFMFMAEISGSELSLETPSLLSE